MKRKEGFTLIKLLVVIAIIALLMAVLMPALTRVRKQAKAVVCQTRLKQWGLYFAMYADDNSSFFHRGCDADPSTGTFDGYWPNALRRLHKDNYKVFTCPMASKPLYDENGVATGAKHPFAAWGVLAPAPGVGPWGYLPSRANDRGSYGTNGWVCNPKVPTNYGPKDSRYWRTPNVKGGDSIPLLSDTLWFAGWPLDDNTAPDYSGHMLSYNFMDFFCANRHDSFVNSLFVDYSVRKVGIKRTVDS